MPTKLPRFSAQLKFSEKTGHLSEQEQGSLNILEGFTIFASGILLTLSIFKKSQRTIGKNI